MIFWDERPQTAQDKMSARVITERQKLRDAYEGWSIRQRETVVCSDCGSMKDFHGNPRWAKWSWQGKPYCTVCVPHRVKPREPIPFVPDEFYRKCVECGGKIRLTDKRSRKAYCGHECKEIAHHKRRKADGGYEGRIPDGTLPTPSETSAL
jgi:endogenous inhibitor of DNA gyrase (YacG/DUF329 family)